MAEHKGSSSVDIDKEKDPNIDSDIVESPTVTLTTPFPQSSVRTHNATVRKLQEAEKEIKAQQRKIQELTFNLEIQDAHLENLRHAETISRLPSIPSAPTATIETPGPHRLQPKPERPEDIAYRAKLEEQKSAEKAIDEDEDVRTRPDNMEVLSLVNSNSVSFSPSPPFENMTWFN